MQLSYWSRTQKDEAYYLNEFFPDGLVQCNPWPHPTPPKACKFALAINDLDCFLFGPVDSKEIVSYQEALPPESRIIAQTTFNDLEINLKLMLSKSFPNATLIQLHDEPPVIKTDHLERYLNDLLSTQPNEPGSFTVDPTKLLAKDKKLFPRPQQSLFKFLDLCLGAAGSTQFQTGEKRSLFSTVHHAKFDGNAPRLADLNPDTIPRIYLTGSTDDPTTWAAAMCLALRELPEMAHLKWNTPQGSWTIRYDENRNPHIEQTSGKGTVQGQTIEIKLSHRFGKETQLFWSNTFNYPSFHQYLKGLSNPIIALRGNNDFPGKDSIEFDQTVDTPPSMIINQLGTGALIFYLNRHPVYFPSPLPCAIHIFGAKFQSDLAKNFSPSQELKNQVLRQAAPYVHQALVRCCKAGGYRDPDLEAFIRSMPRTPKVTQDPSTTLTNQFRYYLNKNHFLDEEAPFLRDQASIEVLLDNIHLPSWQGESWPISVWRRKWGSRIILSSVSQARIPSHIDPSQVVKTTPSMSLPQVLRFLFPNQVLII